MAGCMGALECAHGSTRFLYTCARMHAHMHARARTLLPPPHTHTQVDRVADKASYLDVCVALRKAQDEEVELSSQMQVRACACACMRAGARVARRKAQDEGVDAVQPDVGAHVCSHVRTRARCVCGALRA